MPRLVITVDSGTSNTRARAWHDERIVGAGDAPVGVRDTARTGSRDALEGGVREAIAGALHAAGADAGELRVVLASGMITSSLGLAELAHVVAPAGAEEIARGMLERSLPGVVPCPIWFVPGVRQGSAEATLGSIAGIDMMRGEETETIGLLSRMRGDSPLVALFPGSHAKFVAVDAAGRIAGCLTTLSGELMDSLARHTILASGLRDGWPEALDEAALATGAEMALTDGLARTAFATRVLEVLGSETAAARFSFLLGAVLAQDLLAYAAWHARDPLAARRLVIGGKPVVQGAYAMLARKLAPASDVIVPPQHALADLAGAGAITIARQRGLL